MKSQYLADTHVLLWAFSNPEKLSKKILSVLKDAENEICYSPISLWEISIKYGLGKLSFKGITPKEFYEELSESFFVCLPLQNESLVTSYLLPRHHKDPFDRMLFWEALQNNLVLLSADNASDKYKENGLQVVH
jgi:PIN domain nuclease of toxin-antitoxin system